MVELDTIKHLAAEIGTLTWDYCVADAGTAAPNRVARPITDEPVIPLDPDADLILAPDARAIAGQLVLSQTDMGPRRQRP